AFKIQGDFIAVAGRDVTVQAVFRHIECAVLIPAGFGAVFGLGIRFVHGQNVFNLGIPLTAFAGCFPVGHAVGFVDLFAGGIGAVVGLAWRSARMQIGIGGVYDFLRQGTGQPIGQVRIGLVEEFGD